MNHFNVSNNIRFSSLVSINLSANDWQLNTNVFPRPVIENVASFLNKRFNNGYNKGLQRQELVTSMRKLMEEFTPYGANDVNALGVLDSLVEKVYP